MSSPESTDSFYSANGEETSPSSCTPSEIEYSLSGSSMEEDDNDDTISNEELASPEPTLNSAEEQFEKDLKALLFEKIRLRRLIRELKYDVADLKDENASLTGMDQGDLMDYDQEDEDLNLHDQDSPIGMDSASLDSDGDADDDGYSDDSDDSDLEYSDLEDSEEDGGADETIVKDRELDDAIAALEDFEGYDEIDDEEDEEDEDEDGDKQEQADENEESQDEDSDGEEDDDDESEEEESAVKRQVDGQVDGELDGEIQDGLFSDDDESEEEVFTAPDWCVPIKANVMTFDWESLGKEIQFDVIVADPPWQLATQAPTRGVAIGYDQLPDICIEDIPIDKLQTNGFIFIWVINNKYAKAFEMMEKWGYSYVDDITWVKQTINRRMAKGHGFYLQHAKETCLVGRKGVDPVNCRHAVGTDIIFAERRGQSQKPEEIYELIERLVPNGKYLEIFGRKNNLRDFWVTVGNEL